MGRLLYVLAIICLLVLTETSATQKSEYWLKKVEAELEGTLKNLRNVNNAKNIILFISDGMGVAATTATRIYKGELTNKSGEEGLLSYETFPTVGLSKVYCADQIIPDSSSTASAIYTGVKLNFKTMGVSSDVKKGNCSASLIPANRLKTIFEYAQNASKHTGIITNTRITHATPGAAYAHSADRNWESDSEKPVTARECQDIALQFVNNNVSKNFKIAFGGGYKHFLPKSLNGTRNDSKNLIEEWKRDKSQRNISHRYVNSSQDLSAVDLKNTDQILGLFGPSNRPFINETSETQFPKLSEMVRVAIEKLQQSPEGFVLMVESGRADKAFHHNLAKVGLLEVLELDRAVEMARNMTNETDTLIIVTSDHSQSLVINGNAKRGSSILGLGESLSEADGKPYTVLNFGNGPGFTKHIIEQNYTRWNLTGVDTTADDFIQASAVTPRNGSARHAGEDVAIYASGPWSHLFDGVHEENYIFVAMCYASCVCGDAYKCHNSTKSV